MAICLPLNANIMINYIFPNFGVFHLGRYPRGGLKQRYDTMSRINEKLGSRVFSIVEMPGNFVKKGESERFEFAKWSMLNSRITKSLYAPTKESFLSLRYILHTEPCFPPSIPLKWYDDEWLPYFIKHIESICDTIGRDKLEAIEIHPGLPQRNQNKIDSLAKATINLVRHFKGTLILLENRAGGHIVGSSAEIRQLCIALKAEEPKIFKTFGIVLDLQQIYKRSVLEKCDFREELGSIPKYAVKGVHIHSVGKKAGSHQPPTVDDPIDWQVVKRFTNEVRKRNSRLMVLPEVHTEKALIQTLTFCKRYLDLNYSDHKR